MVLHNLYKINYRLKLLNTARVDYNYNINRKNFLFLFSE